MTELKVTLPDRLACDARKAGLLSTKAIQDLLREAMRRLAARGARRRRGASPRR